MTVKKPTALGSLQKVSPPAGKFAGQLAAIDLTKFRFRVGCGFGIGSIILFLVGHSKIVAEQFVEGFTQRSWDLTIFMMVLCPCLCGKEIADSFVSVVKALKSVREDHQ